MFETPSLETLESDTLCKRQSPAPGQPTAHREACGARHNPGAAAQQPHLTSLFATLCAACYNSLSSVLGALTYVLTEKAGS